MSTAPQHAPVPPAPGTAAGHAAGPATPAYATAAPGYAPTGAGAAPVWAGPVGPGLGAPAPRRSGLAVAALVLGLLALLGCLVPVLNVGSVGLGLAALVVGVLAIRRLVPGVTGKGMAVAGIVTGVVGALVAAAMWIALVALGSAVEDGALEDLSVDLGTSLAASSYDCGSLGTEAVSVSEQVAVDQPLLLSVTDAVVVEDHRSDFVTPTEGETLVLACSGTASWSDGSESGVTTELTVDAEGELFVAYQQQ
ncbi:hypothetical protein [Cellulomonas endophytica]|uniref:hypothetical protein n=1 Tax=Cellulomonas endophytica TaxID=2494735 RepID=UPI0013E94850|nr:hypothetical protein [Cellulomonas endophytica]